MKKLRIFLHTCETRLEQRWQKLSARRQRKFVILFFAGYLLVTGCVVLKVWYDAKTEALKPRPIREQIRNPILEDKNPELELKDSSSTQQKKEGYERK
ncbi:nitrogen regulatory IIA protein [Chryseobacterium herbae]|uniref:Nitrogen regulatory IIA protein n=1 Tax=Chryseobacterium herbae TaxID=2976476 RepID=A0ABT2ISI8_9FLAO|nr:nitrogen regulatory IIA protein [Chryseobacterium sp. pc1-10]MCT2561799.1 nitrogen regulatory IIA protein [Chryseobacterium sp. pc1-10]